jgi:hypothetical protein
MVLGANIFFQVYLIIVFIYQIGCTYVQKVIIPLR